jgi:transcriptional regulator with XRE-family HTH domain
VTVEKRLDRLRNAKGLTWDELGTLLGLSRTMLHYLRTGKREMGIHARRRLSEAEKEAGIRDREEELLTTIAAEGALARQIAKPGEEGMEIQILNDQMMRAHDAEYKLRGTAKELLKEMAEIRQRLDSIESKLQGMI